MSADIALEVSSLVCLWFSVFPILILSLIAAVADRRPEVGRGLDQHLGTWEGMGGTRLVGYSGDWVDEYPACWAVASLRGVCGARWLCA